jgi:hypothetical protein
VSNPVKPIEYVLYAIPKGETESYMEQILLSDASDPVRVAKVKKVAAVDGFHSFRLSKIDMTARPDFTKAVRRQ